MRIVHDRYRADRCAATRLVLLPPAKADADALVAEGFVAAVRARGLPVDLTLADIGAHHVLDGSVADALQHEVIVPARQEGCQAIWLAGISLGAFCALSHAAQHADQLAGMLLLAPYPGTADILDEIRTAGGPAAWAADPASSHADERAWWHWLARAAGSGECRLYLGIAADDRFIAGQMLLASLFPAARVQCIDGDHSWPVWRRMWQHWLSDGPLAAEGNAPC
jgi:pimeloyl-ACP methyl ester carboxylesterase